MGKFIECADCDSQLCAVYKECIYGNPPKPEASLSNAVVRETYNQMHETAVEMGFPSILEALEELARRIEAEAVLVVECPSCHGLNLSCPHGCGRDPATGELDGSTYAAPPKEPTT